MANTSRLELIITADASGAISAVTKTGDAVGGADKKTRDAASGGFRALNDVMSDLKGRAEGFAGALGPMLSALGGWGIAAAAASAVAVKSLRDFSAFGEQVRNLSYLSGASAESTSHLLSAMDDLGVQSDAVEQALRRMSMAIMNGDAALNRLGVSTRDSSGQFKNGITLIYESIDALQGMQDTFQRNAIAQEMFGKSWAAMLPIIQQGSHAIQQLGLENDKIITEQQLEELRQYNLAVKDLGNSFERLTVQLGAKLAPLLTNVFNYMTGPSAWEAAQSAERMLQQLLGAPNRELASDVGAWRLGKPGAQAGGAVPAETAAEMEKRLRLASQVSQLMANAQLAAASSTEEQMAAQMQVIAAQRAAAQSALSVALKAGTYKDETEIAQLRLAINAEADAKIVALREKLQSTQLERSIAGWVAMAQAQVDADFEAATAAAERDAALWAQRDEWKRIIDEGNIASIVAQIEQEQALYEQALQIENARYAEQAEWREQGRQAEIAYHVAMVEAQIEADFAAAEARAKLYEQEQQRRQQMQAMTVTVAANMAGAMLSMYETTGKKHEAFFRTWQAFKIAETLISTYSSAMKSYEAMAGIPIIGPALGFAAAAAAIAFGLAQVAAIAAAKPSGGGGVASAPSGGGYAYNPAVQPYGTPQKEASERPLVVYVNVAGNVVDHDQFARELVPSIRKAIDDRV